MSDSTSDVGQHYKGVAANYGAQYERDRLTDLSSNYPANYFRLQLLLNSFVTSGTKRVIEVGVGEGTPLTTLGRAGIEVWGFDIVADMAAQAKEKVEKLGQSGDQIFVADIQDPTSYMHALRDGAFDALMAMGVMPHVRNDEFVIRNMMAMVKPGGKLFIEFRNKLFSLFTFNRYTVDFILNDLLAGVSKEMKETVRADLETRCRMDMPPVRGQLAGGGAPGYDAILSKFHNPFEVVPMMQSYGLTDCRLLWYHYHPSAPYLAEKNPALFRSEAIGLEHETSDWRGYFLCSAFVVEARKPL